MRIEEVITQKAWYPFGYKAFKESGGRIGWGERREKRVYLSKQDQQLLRRASALLAKIREAVDPHEWLEYGSAQDVPEQSMTLGSAEAFVSEVASWGEYIVIDDTPRAVASGGVAYEVEAK